MLKKDIAKNVAERLGIELEDIKVIMDTVFSEISNGVGSGETVFLRGLGTFEIYESKMRMRHDLTLGKTVVQPPKKRLKFVPGKSIMKMLRETNQK